MSSKTWAAEDGALEAALTAIIVQLARTASVEINVPDVKHLEASRALLAPGTRVYVSHLPKQQWQDTEAACRAVHAAGFYPVPHIPARLLPDTATLEQMLASLAGNAGVKEVLLIAGDHPAALGPYACVSDILHSGLLSKHGYQRVSLAGHPEGHPKVALEVIRRAELEKAQLAAAAGLDTTFLTQFFFESAPFLQWSSELRAQGVRARLVGGLAGPAGLATLFKYALRCGTGPSIRALGARPSSFLKLLGDHGPESVVRELAAARAAAAVTRPATAGFTGIHLFCFGGYLRTCEWLCAVMDGRISMNYATGFVVLPLT
jgi:methylenetetrahydrofolate reductase (NADPH)